MSERAEGKDIIHLVIEKRSTKTVPSTLQFCAGHRQPISNHPILFSPAPFIYLLKAIYTTLE